MNVCMVLDGSFPFDVRVDKEARTLISLNHRVFLLCASQPGQVREESAGGVRVRRVNSSATFNAKLAAFVYAVTFFHPRWFSELWRFAREQQIDILHIHDLPLALTAIIVARLCRLPVVLDLHEPWPESVATWGWRSPIYGRALYYVLLRLLERLCLRSVDEAIVVSEGWLEFYCERGISPGKLHVLGNYVELSLFDALPIDAALVEKYLRDFPIVYVGAGGAHRALDSAIRAMPEILRQIPQAFLLVGGDLGPATNQLRSLAASLGVNQRVEFLGPLSRSEVRSYLALARVCILLFNDAGGRIFKRSCSSNKLYEYAAAAKPVVVTDTPGLTQMVRSSGCGIVVPPNDISALSRAVVSLGDRQAAAGMGANGRVAVERNYCWEKNVPVLREVYAKLGYHLMTGAGESSC